MKKLLPIITALFFAACTEDSQQELRDTELQVPTSGTCLVVNMGNYSESNGSICTMKYGEAIRQSRFQEANGFPLRSIIESATLTPNYLLLMCGNEDKVEILDRQTFKEVCKAITGIGLPRYATVVGGAAYVTCVNPSWRDTVGYVTKINLDSKKVEARIKLRGNPEGITHSGNQIFAASGNGVFQIDGSADTVARFIALPHPDRTCTGRYFVTDADGDLWLSFSNVDLYGNSTACGIAELTPGKPAFNRLLVLPKMCADAYIDIAPDGQTLYYLYASEIVGGRNPEAETNIYKVNLTTGEADNEPLCKGVGFYGFNVDPNTGNIFTANVNGFITNSMLSIYSADGTLLQDGLMTGVGTCRWLFY